MPFNTFGVATAVTPSVIETYFSHFLNRKPLKEKPTAHISYHEGLKLIRQFLDYSSRHTVEDLQAFTQQWVPVPTWVRTQDVEIPPQFMKRSANLLKKQLGNNGLERVGGEKWWQWRRLESPMHAEWIEMKKDYNERKRDGTKCDRVILYVHGGAYYFGSVDEHRYQMQRHARKLKARLLAPRYRLAPQFPFPCGLYDCIATYFYLLEHFDPSQVLIAGDSAGGGMVLAMLTTLRDQGCPLPAGTILLSPWVDLTHSFPSVSGDGKGDYIPPHGFHHKPSMAWPPPPQTEEKAKKIERNFTQPVEQPFEVVELPADMSSPAMSSKPSMSNLRDKAAQDKKKLPEETLNSIPGMGDKLQLTIDQNIIQVKEQFQMYTTNELLTHPLVSAVQQPSLGGLPPMLIQVGGAELLRDEQIYLAHKAANPRAFPPSQPIMDMHDPQRIVLNQYPPTDVQLQVWEDLCHVPHTLSFTRPAKYMYRSVAQFGAWALARAQKKGIEILDDDAISIISDGGDENSETGSRPESDRFSTYGSIGMDGVSSTQFKLAPVGAIGKAGDQLPPFRDHMIRQRVNRHGVVFPLPHPSEIASLHLAPETIGALKRGPVQKWLGKRTENEQKFAKDYKALMKKRAKELKDGYDTIDGESPPPSALVNRRRKGIAPEEKKKGKSWGLAMWSGWGSSHDESTIEREEKILNERAEAEQHAQDSLSIQRSASVAPSTTTATTKTSTKEEEKAEATMSALAAAGFGGAAPSKKKLAVPSNEADAETKRNRRQSGASSIWSRSKDRPMSPYTKVRDAGQTSTERGSSITSAAMGGSESGFSPSSPVARNNSHAGSIPWDQFSRRSSGGSGKKPMRDRPGSVVGAVAPALEDVPQSPTSFENAPSFPSTSDTRPDAAKVPGTDHTYLNPESSRPHNGTVAYPFKLRNLQTPDGRPVPNPSTTTLESIDHDEPESSADAQNKDDNLVVPKMTPVTTDGVPVESPADKQGPAHPETSAPPDDVSSSAVDAANKVAKPRPESTTLGVATRPISMLSPSTVPKHLKTPENDPVSPISPLETSTSEPSSAVSELPPPSVSAAASASQQYKLRNRYETRDSRLGFLGADGMPTAAWPERFAQKTESQADSAPKTAPFKIRNPVHDARAAAVQAPASVQQQQQPQQPESQVEAPKPAPFKMRHVVYDPSRPIGQQNAPGAGNGTTAMAAAHVASGASGATEPGAANREVPSTSNVPQSQAAAPTESPVIRPTIYEESSPTNTSSSENELPGPSQSKAAAQAAFKVDTDPKAETLSTSTERPTPAATKDDSARPAEPVQQTVPVQAAQAAQHSLPPRTSSTNLNRSASVTRKAVPPTSKFSSAPAEAPQVDEPPQQSKKSLDLPEVVPTTAPSIGTFSFETASPVDSGHANPSMEKFDRSPVEKSPIERSRSPFDMFSKADKNLKNAGKGKEKKQKPEKGSKDALKQAGFF